jgi:hypothetical protein
MLTAGVVAMSFVVASVVADELFGVITKVDVEGKKITVEEKETNKEFEIKITDETKTMRKGEEVAVDLKKLEDYVKKVQDAGKKGVTVKVTHEKGVASKLETKRGSGKKKAE